MGKRHNDDSKGNDKGDGRGTHGDESRRRDDKDDPPRTDDGPTTRAASNNEDPRNRLRSNVGLKKDRDELGDGRAGSPRPAAVLAGPSAAGREAPSEGRKLAIPAVQQARSAAAVPPPTAAAAPDRRRLDPELLKGAWRVARAGEARRLSSPLARGGENSGRQDGTHGTYGPSDNEDEDGRRVVDDGDEESDEERSRRARERIIPLTEGTLVEAIDLVDAEADHSRRKRIVRIGSLVLLVVVVAVVSVAVGVTLSLRGSPAPNPPTSAPTLAPTVAPVAITEEMLDAFLRESRLTNATLAAMGVEGTPQARALLWLRSKAANRSVILDDANPVRRLRQQYALAVMYYASSTPAGGNDATTAGGNGWTNSSGWLVDVDECEWFGCRCRRTEDGSSWELAGLDLSQNGLAATTLPLEIGIVESLAALDLSGNKFSGTIPSELGRLSKLQALALTNNTFTGAIPAQLYQATDLASLDLDNNQLRGSVSSQVGQLTKLTTLNIWANEGLTGTLPTELGLLTRLTQLAMLSTQFTAPGLGGTIPSELGALAGLTSLTLSGYGFSGTIPEELAKLTSSKSLVLTWNQLSGTLPAGLGLIRSLGELDVRENAGLTGTVPEQLCSLIDDNNLALCVTSTNISCSESCGCACV